MQHQTIYVHIRTNIAYPLAADGKAIDIKSPILEPLDMSRYKKAGGNNAFTLYELKARYQNQHRKQK